VVAKTPPMTAEDAVQFGHFSMANALMAVADLTASGACKGGCVPYEDVFTYRRWAAQGMQVQKGQHGAKLPVVVRTVDKKTGEERTLLWTTTVFCRCQCKPRE
jgi:hypothetical protein